MSRFLIPRRKIFELCSLPIFLGILFFFYPKFEALVLFSFGFVWNWAASNNLEALFENKRYRMSMLKLVVNLQYIMLRPFQKFPNLIKKLLKVFPAGIFWSLVIYLNESTMPWWATFLGSFIFEIIQIEIEFIKEHRKIS